MSFPLTDRVIQRVAEDKVRAAMEAGAFSNLAGAGKPLACLDEPWDEFWWIKQWIKREGLSSREIDVTTAERQTILKGLAALAAKR